MEKRILEGSLTEADFLIKIASFVKKKEAVQRGADLS
jgi:hypothetical protein